MTFERLPRRKSRQGILPSSASKVGKRSVPFVSSGSRLPVSAHAAFRPIPSNRYQQRIRSASSNLRFDDRARKLWVFMCAIKNGSCLECLISRTINLAAFSQLQQINRLPKRSTVATVAGRLRGIIEAPGALSVVKVSNLWSNNSPHGLSWSLLCGGKRRTIQAF